MGREDGSITRFHLIHTNDLHSHFDHWPQTVTVIKKIKKELEEKGEPYILIDIGDHMDRSHVITEGTLGQANVHLMNEIGYDFVTLGNNEGITFDKATLDLLYQRANFQVLLNNLYEYDGKRPQWTVPYTMLTHGDLKIGLIGSTISFDLFYEILGWKTEDPFQQIEENVQELRSQADVIVLLSHLGLTNDKCVAQDTSGIDIILGAHTHQVLYEGETVNHCLIAQAGRSGEYVGWTTIEMEQKRVRDIQTRCLTTAEETKDTQALHSLAYFQQQAVKNLSHPIVTLAEQWEIAWYKESGVGNLLAEGLRDWCSASVSFVNAGQILHHLPVGQVTRQDLHRICPHPINPCVVQLTGKQIWAILQRSLDPELQQLKIKGFGFRGERMGILCVDGIKILINEINGEKAIQEIHIQDQPIDKERHYSVATIDMFTFGQIFPELYRHPNVHYLLPDFLRDVLAYRLQQGDLEKATHPRWKVVNPSGGETV